jgi:hypothetical protein
MGDGRDTHARVDPDVVSRIRCTYEAYNASRFAEAVALLSPAVEWIEPESFPGGGTYVGREAVMGYLARAKQAWHDTRSEPALTVAYDSRVLVLVRHSGRATPSGPLREAYLADLFTVDDGAVTRMEAFADPNEALAALGLGRLLRLESASDEAGGRR